MEGKVPLSINVPVRIKKALKEMAQKQGVTMTDLVIQWVEESKIKK